MAVYMRPSLNVDWFTLFLCCDDCSEAITSAGADYLIESLAAEGVCGQEVRRIRGAAALMPADLVHVE